MSGHSKWHSIRFKKGIIDARRGKLFSKLAKEIIVAARVGGGDPDNNPRLRTVIANARSVSMPNDNIMRAIKRGTGEVEGSSYEEIVYEAYGPAGVALLIEVLTDNRNRTAGEVRSILTKKGGSLAGTNAVMFQFDRKGQIRIPTDATSEDELFMLATEAGAENLENDDGMFVVTTSTEEFETVRAAIEAAGTTIESASLVYLPQNVVPVGRGKAKQVLDLMNALEDQDDVQRVHANFDIPDEVLAELSDE
jgi:YebC/PmpR family DNA-binding regulatory protein